MIDANTHEVYGTCTRRAANSACHTIARVRYLAVPYWDHDTKPVYWGNGASWNTIRGQRADMVIVDDMIEDDPIDATFFGPMVLAPPHNPSLSPHMSASAEVLARGRLTSGCTGRTLKRARAPPKNPILRGAGRDGIDRNDRLAMYPHRVT